MIDNEFCWGCGNKITEYYKCWLCKKKLCTECVSNCDLCDIHIKNPKIPRTFADMKDRDNSYTDEWSNCDDSFMYLEYLSVSKNNKNILIKITTDMWEYLECEYGEYIIIDNINEIAEYKIHMSIFNPPLSISCGWRWYIFFIIFTNKFPRK